MKIREKIREYSIRSGVRDNWIAQQLRITAAQFYAFKIGRIGLPVRCWLAIIELTGGEVTIGDLIEDWLRDIEFVEVKIKSKNKCEVRIKNVGNVKN